jgi:hypothetical protein
MSDLFTETSQKNPDSCILNNMSKLSFLEKELVLENTLDNTLEIKKNDSPAYHLKKIVN